MDKYTAVNLYDVILFGIKKKGTTKPQKYIDESKYVLRGEGSQLDRATYSMNPIL